MAVSSGSVAVSGTSHGDLSVGKVLSAGLCIGCGACAIGKARRYEIAETELGFLQAVPKADLTGAEAEPDRSGLVCPHSGLGSNEDDLAKPLFSADNDFDERTGYWQAAGVFSMRDEPDRLAGSSGGGVTWMLRQLLASGRVDTVLHVKANLDGATNGGPIYTYAISRTVEELEDGRKSAYYPVSFASVVEQMRNREGAYAIVAIPCFAKALRKLAEQDPVIAERLRYVVGIVCGHLKSRYYAEFLSWSVGVRPSDMQSIDFRMKNKSGGAGDYGIAVKSPSGVTVSRRLGDYFGTPWELVFMMYKACDYCDDVFCETADVVFGDAWIPPYDKDWRGHNVVISRRPEITAMLRSPDAAGEVEFEEVGLDRVIASQVGGLRHRRDGLAVRLAHDEAQGRWHPRKRVKPDKAALATKRGKMYLQRSALREMSVSSFRRAKKIGSFPYFGLCMSIPVFRYYYQARGLKTAIRQIYPTKLLKRFLR